MSNIFKPGLDHAGGLGADKATQHHWDDIEDIPYELCRIKKTLLWIDYDTQRSDISRENINAIAAEWNWVHAGVLIVCRRGDKFMVIEGQHRLLAAMKRREIIELPCIVFRFRDVAQEARAFLAINTRRKAVSAIDKHRIGGRGGDEVIAKANEVLVRAGVSIAKDPKGSDQTKAVAAVKNAIKSSGDDAVVSILSILRQIEWPHGIPSTTIRAMCYLRKNIDGGIDQRFVSRLIAIGSDQILAAENRGAALGGSQGERMRSIGLLEAINKGLQNRYRFRGEQ